MRSQDLLPVVVKPENFADDALRLAYADLLEEEGDSLRAEFIRIQLAVFVMDENGEGEIDPNEGHTCHEYPCPICTQVEKYQKLKHREREIWNSGGWKFWDSPFGGADGERFKWYHRGFVNHVRCTLEDWYGGICRRCYGTKSIRVVDTDKLDFIRHRSGISFTPPQKKAICSTCRGNGITIRQGPEVVKQQPIEIVEVANRLPLLSVGDSVARWTWYRGSGGEVHAWQLPAEIFHLLPTGPGSNCFLIRDSGEHNYTFSIRDYDSEADGNTALSVALLLWARKQQ